MTSNSLILIAVDVVAALILSFGVYYRRHRRRDLVVAFLGVNIGVLAVATVLGTADVAAGLGLGLFGVLSIIRLRSSEISQREVAYYFAALAMGLIGGLAQSNITVATLLIALILVVMWGADHPSLLGSSRHQLVRLDRAVVDEAELRGELEDRLGGTVTAMTVQNLDFVNDTTLIDVRYKAAGHGSRATVDEDITWSNEDGERLRAPGRTILETKTAGPASELDRALWGRGPRPTSISKFGTGTAALHPELPSNKWASLLRREDLTA